MIFIFLYNGVFYYVRMSYAGSKYYHNLIFSSSPQCGKHIIFWSRTVFSNHYTMIPLLAILNLFKFNVIDTYYYDIQCTIGTNLSIT